MEEGFHDLPSASPPSSPSRVHQRPRGVSDPSNLEAELNAIRDEKTIYKFVITGGPCAGKTTGMERLAVFLRERGFRVFVVPEAATMLFLNGAFPDDLANVECAEAFQQFVLATQVSLEDSMRNYARSLKQKAVILCDRGVMDGSAYVDSETWNKVLSKNNMDVVAAREGRYDAVFHLVTAADGAQDFYTLANNNARHESMEAAQILDRKTQGAWNGHPHHIIVDNRNSRSFERKMEQFVSMVAERVGLPSLTRRRHKLVLTQPPDLTAVASAMQVFDVEKIMLAEGTGALPNEGGDRVLYSFVRKRSQGGFSAYGLTTVKQLPSGEKVELKQVISRRMYSILAGSADQSRNVVRQRRYCFLWEMQSFHIYEFLAPHQGIWIANVHAEGEPVIPEFLSVDKDAANDSSFSTREISLIERSPTPSLSGQGQAEARIVQEHA